MLTGFVFVAGCLIRHCERLSILSVCASPVYTGTIGNSVERKSRSRWISLLRLSVEKHTEVGMCGVTTISAVSNEIMRPSQGYSMALKDINDNDAVRSRELGLVSTVSIFAYYR